MIIGGAVLLGLALTGCTSTTETTDTQPHGFANVQPSDAASADSKSVDITSEQSEFLEYVRSHLPADTLVSDASDAELLEAGNAACAAFDDQTDILDVRLFEGEQPDAGGYYKDTTNVAGAASAFLCPDSEINHPDNRATPEPSL